MSPRRGEVDHRPDGRLAAVLVALLLAGIAGPVIWALSVADRLPDEVARHWGVDGVGATWSLPAQLLVMSAVALLVAAPIGAAAVLGRMALAVRRMLAGCAAWTVALLAGLQVDGLRGHLDLTDPFAAPTPTLGIGLGATLGLGVALGVGATARETSTPTHVTEPPPSDLPRLAPDQPPSRDARGPWSPALTAVSIGSAAVFVAMAVVLGWVPLLIGVVLLVVILAHVRFTVAVDEGGGVRIGNRLLTMLHVPAEQIAGAEVATVDPFWEFGGWGLRVDAHGRVGVVTRQGEALVLRRGDGGEVVVSVDDAEVLAGTINSLIDHQRSR